jgi:predicted dehydrogenase
MTQRPRLGFLGVGWIGRHRMQAVVESGSAQVVAVCDASESACQAALALAPGAGRYASLDALLELEDLDGVVIATPSAQHAPQALAALSRGRAVFCQKPLARTAAETRDVLQAAERADRLLAVDFCYRHTAALRALHEAVQRGDLGDVYAAKLVFHNAYGPDKPWFYERAASGGGCVIDLGVHLVDAALWILGFPRVSAVNSRLYAGGRRLAPGESAVEDFAALSIELSGGRSVELACSWNLPAGQDAVIGVELYGTRASAVLSNVAGSFYDFRAELLHKTSRTPLAEPPDAWGGRAILDFAARLAQSSGYDARAAQLLRVAETIDAVYGLPAACEPRPSTGQGRDTLRASGAP